ncbi:hypothetical protein BT69DRAFT_1315904 [Atractiella rhizophila]|nr:hypothetical protein BT69DRAFT_1315904 [Atractiella rhizophila]
MSQLTNGSIQCTRCEVLLSKTDEDNSDAALVCSMCSTASSNVSPPYSETKSLSDFTAQSRLAEDEAVKRLRFELVNESLSRTPDHLFKHFFPNLATQFWSCGLDASKLGSKYGEIIIATHCARGAMSSQHPAILGLSSTSLPKVQSLSGDLRAYGRARDSRVKSLLYFAVDLVKRSDILHVPSVDGLVVLDDLTQYLLCDFDTAQAQLAKRLLKIRLKHFQELSNAGGLKSSDKSVLAHGLFTSDVQISHTLDEPLILEIRDMIWMFAGTGIPLSYYLNSESLIRLDPSQPHHHLVTEACHFALQREILLLREILRMVKRSGEAEEVLAKMEGKRDKAVEWFNVHSTRMSARVSQPMPEGEWHGSRSVYHGILLIQDFFDIASDTLKMKNSFPTPAILKRWHNTEMQVAREFHVLAGYIRSHIQNSPWPNSPTHMILLDACKALTNVPGGRQAFFTKMMGAERGALPLEERMADVEVCLGAMKTLGFYSQTYGQWATDVENELKQVAQRRQTVSNNGRRSRKQSDHE